MLHHMQKIQIIIIIIIVIAIIIIIAMIIVIIIIIIMVILNGNICTEHIALSEKQSEHKKFKTN